VSPSPHCRVHPIQQSLHVRLFHCSSLVRPNARSRNSVISCRAGSQPRSTTTSTAFGMVVHIPGVPCERFRTVELLLSCYAPSKDRSHGSLPTDRQCPRCPPQRNAEHCRHTTGNAQRNGQMSGRSAISLQWPGSVLFYILPEISLKQVNLKMREESPVEVLLAGEDFRDGYYVQCNWMRAISSPKGDAAYQKARVFTLPQAFLPLTATTRDR